MNALTKNTIVCYTAITGNYDRLRDPVAMTPDVDFVCFTDNPHLQSVKWQIRPIPKELGFLSNVKKQRILKICPHRFLGEYDVSIWIDANVQVRSDLSIFLKQYDLSEHPLYVRKHPMRDCLYAEAETCAKIGKDSADTIHSQLARYRSEGVPQKLGLAETNILLRRHNEPKCQMLDDFWAAEVLDGSHRDQISFNYACWKAQLEYGILTYQQYITLNRSEFFDTNGGHGEY